MDVPQPVYGPLIPSSFISLFYPELAFKRMEIYRSVWITTQSLLVQTLLCKQNDDKHPTTLQSTRSLYLTLLGALLKLSLYGFH